MPQNVFKQNLASGSVQYGGWCSIGDAVVAEIMATAGFDWLLIDGEHGPNHLRSMLAQLQAVQAYSVAPLVRVPTGDAVLIKQCLDALSLIHI